MASMTRRLIPGRTFPFHLGPINRAPLLTGPGCSGEKILTGDLDPGESPKKVRPGRGPALRGRICSGWRSIKKAGF